MNTMSNPEQNNSEQSSVGRRKFLQLAASAAAMAGSSTAMSAQQETPARQPEITVNEPGALPPVRAGSDFMLDVIKSLGFEYVAANPGGRSQTLRRILIFDDDAATLALLSDLDVVAPRAKIGWYIFAFALVTAVILGMFWPLL